MVFTISIGMISERSVDSVVAAGVVTRQSRNPSAATATRLLPVLCRKMPPRNGRDASSAAANAGLLIIVFGRQKILDFVWIDVVVDAMIKTASGSYVRGPLSIGNENRCGLGRAVFSATRRGSESRPAPIRSGPHSRSAGR